MTKAVVLVIVAICFGLAACGHDNAASADRQPPQSVDCTEIGAVCSLRPPRRSALVATSLKADREFHNAYNDNDLLGKMLGNGKLAILLSGAQVRILNLNNGIAEAIVTTDNYVPGRGPSGRPIGMTGAQLAGRKVWLDITQWTKIN